MGLDKASSTNKDTSVTPGGSKPSKSLRDIVERGIKHSEDLRKNLGLENEKSVYDKIERNLTDQRNELKGKLMDIEDPDYEYLNRSELRKNSAQDVLQKYTQAAGSFQEAQVNNKLDRPKATDLIENLTYSLKNFNHHLDRSSEK